MKVNTLKMMQPKFFILIIIFLNLLILSESYSCSKDELINIVNSQGLRLEKINSLNIETSEKIKDMITTLQAVRKEDFNLFDLQQNISTILSELENAAILKPSLRQQLGSTIIFLDENLKKFKSSSGHRKSNRLYSRGKIRNKTPQKTINLETEKDKMWLQTISRLYEANAALNLDDVFATGLTFSNSSHFTRKGFELTQVQNLVDNLSDKLDKAFEVLANRYEKYPMIIKEDFPTQFHNLERMIHRSKKDFNGTGLIEARDINSENIRSFFKRIKDMEHDYLRLNEDGGLIIGEVKKYSNTDPNAYRNITNKFDDKTYNNYDLAIKAAKERLELIQILQLGGYEDTIKLEMVFHKEISEQLRSELNSMGVLIKIIP